MVFGGEDLIIMAQRERVGFVVGHANADVIALVRIAAVWVRCRVLGVLAVMPLTKAAIPLANARGGEGAGWVIIGVASRQILFFPFSGATTLEGDHMPLALVTGLYYFGDWTCHGGRRNSG